MAQQALKNSYDLAKQAQETLYKSQEDQARAGFASSEAAFQRAYEDSVNQYTRAYEQAKSEFESKQVSAEEQAAKLAQQAYAQKMQQQRVSGNLLQQAGLSGQGYSESVLGRISTAYQNAWSNTMEGKNQAVNELNRLIGQAYSDKQFGVSNASSARDFGISQARSDLEQGIIGIQGQRNAALLNLESQYQRDLANYLASLRSASGGSTTPTATSKTPKASVQDIRAGLNQITFDPRTQNYTNLENYLMNYVNNGSITIEQAEAMFNDHMKKYVRNYSPSGLKPGSTPQRTGTTTGTANTTTTPAKSGTTFQNTLMFK